MERSQQCTPHKYAKSTPTPPRQNRHLASEASKARGRGPGASREVRHRSLPHVMVWLSCTSVIPHHTWYISFLPPLMPVMLHACYFLRHNIFRKLWATFLMNLVVCSTVSTQLLVIGDALLSLLTKWMVGFLGQWTCVTTGIFFFARDRKNLVYCSIKTNNMQPTWYDCQS